MTAKWVANAWSSAWAIEVDVVGDNSGFWSERGSVLVGLARRRCCAGAGSDSGGPAPGAGRSQPSGVWI